MESRIISPTLSYFHIISFMSRKVRKSNKSASLKLIESYSYEVWSLIFKFLSNMVYVPMNSVKTLNEVIYQAQVEKVHIIEFHIHKWRCNKLMCEDRVNRTCDYLQPYNKRKLTEYLIKAMAGIYFNTF